ncbi:Phosphoribosylanthranilate isomerase [Salinisphaera sp. T5B8]|uniref:phosphoribosylanthranilate isomerase n=1 Tax=Salinisphaera sp. T5B8 TaxID=1304154 RepID=UPI0033417690
MKRVRIKICGITRLEDALASVNAGADAIGFVFHEPSTRAIDIEQACAISHQLPPFVARVALFLEPAPAAVQTVLDRLHPDALQFHGRETAEFCRRFAWPYLKSVPMGEDNIEPRAWADYYHDAQGLLLDANRAGAAGGSGETFDWERQAALPDMPIVIAGGLHADNVGEAITRFHPYAVDVSSGVESAPGIKDAERIRAFTAAVSRARPGGIERRRGEDMAEA